MHRGGTISYTIRSLSNNTTTNQSEIPVGIVQRHSWRRSYRKSHFCDNNTIASSGLIGEGQLVSHSIGGHNISALVQCTDFSEKFDYSSGEDSTLVTLPINRWIEYFYKGCCWIPLLPPDTDNGNVAKKKSFSKGWG